MRWLKSLWEESLYVNEYKRYFKTSININCKKEKMYGKKDLS